MTVFSDIGPTNVVAAPGMEPDRPKSALRRMVDVWNLVGFMLQRKSQESLNLR